MPSEAFYKLDESNKKKILEAIKREFECNGFEKASVNKIIENAGISKGSFWFYFENKEEAINFIIESYIEIEKEKALELIKEKNGDIFETYIGLYDFIKEQKIEEYKRELLPSIFKDLIINKEKIFKKFSPMPLLDALMRNDDFNKNINMNRFKRPTKQEIISVIKILNYIMRTNIIDQITGNIEEKESKENFLREIEIVKKGVLK